MFTPYCNSLTEYSRRKTRTVHIGDVPMGSDHPIRIQSMTTTDTMDTLKTVEQSIRMIEAGCEYIRITAPSINEAKNLENIKKELRARGYQAPLIADIHFTPNAAEMAARLIEKVRVNPGNYADKKKFDIIEYTEGEYEAELERIRMRFTPLVKICKEYGTAMRIGTNHGSLSDRIMSRYGDTPLGMVESALEFLNICRDENYHEIVLSMKASNPQVMVQAYRLLVSRMNAAGMDYPLHIGVTEAGDGDDGRIKSAIGIGCLLEDGLGDTVRVSLTEDPEFEAPVAKALVARYTHRAGHAALAHSDAIKYTLDRVANSWSPYEYTRRHTYEIGNMGGHQVPRVIADLSHLEVITEFDLQACGHIYDAALDKWHMTDQGCDYIYCGNQVPPFMLPNGLKAIVNKPVWDQLPQRDIYYPLTEIKNIDNPSNHPEINFVSLQLRDFSTINLEAIKKREANTVLVLETEHPHGMAEQRLSFFNLLTQQISCPVIIKRNYHLPAEELILHCATDAGSLLLDGLGDGIWLNTNGSNIAKTNSYGFGILQACRTRISKTEYISCPSCGRTLFDLQETTAMIRKRTEHLKGIKIAIMGCIVNGPGEMADADYGYVGSGPGKITLYRGKEVIRKNVTSEQAVDELIGLISEDGNWVEAAI
jgi:(E)-4-hydroxy-3-methylbut-2-enyl-diphosphate synthase